MNNIFDANNKKLVSCCWEYTKGMKLSSRLSKYIISVSIFICVLVFTGESFAASQLVIAPTRVVFSDKMRSAQVTLVNSGDEAGTYRISFVNKRMTEDGRFEDVKEARPGEQFAKKMIRFSPRQVVLEPGQSQVVRLGLRKPANLEPGEYRSHMVFKAVPKDAGRSIESAGKADGIKIQLTAIVAVSIPVIVRQGETSAEVAFVKASFQKRKEKEDYPHLLLELERSGNQSVYGDFLAEFVDSEGKRAVVGQAKGVAIYTPGTKRLVRLPLTVPSGVELANGVIQVLYRSPVDKGGKVMAQTQIKMP